MKITMIGLGAMGSAIAACLLEIGHDLTVWNRSRKKAIPLVEKGASLASTLQEAVDASPLIVVCIKGHRETLDCLAPLSGLQGKTVCDLGTGDAADAERLVDFVRSAGADWMLGMINAYPSGIGGDETAILTVGSERAWNAHGDVIRALGGASQRVGGEASALAALFAGLFTVRQGFMFGMIFGALACKKAGIPMQVFVDQIPSSAMNVAQAYYQTFASTVPPGDYDAPQASLEVYVLAQRDALKTFESLGAPADFIRLIHDTTDAALADGLGGKQLTALVDYMSR